MLLEGVVGTRKFTSGSPRVFTVTWT
jgi:hypothetical protein